MNFQPLWCLIGAHPPDAVENHSHGHDHGFKRCTECGRDFDHYSYT